MSSANKRPRPGKSPPSPTQLELNMESVLVRPPAPKEPPAKKRGRKEPPEKKPREKKAYAWTMLHEARQAQRPEPAVKDSASPGRPPKTMPTKVTSVAFTAGEEEALHKWQAIFKEFLGRKPSIGETAGILARVCFERWEMLPDESKQPSSLVEFVRLFLGEELAQDTE